MLLIKMHPFFLMLMRLWNSNEFICLYLYNIKVKATGQHHNNKAKMTVQLRQTLIY